MTNSEKRSLIRNIQAAINYSEIKATVEGISRRGKLPHGLIAVAPFRISVTERMDMGLMACIASSTQNGWQGKSPKSKKRGK